MAALWGAGTWAPKSRTVGCETHASGAKKRGAHAIETGGALPLGELRSSPSEQLFKEDGAVRNTFRIRPPFSCPISAISRFHLSAVSAQTRHKLTPTLCAKLQSTQARCLRKTQQTDNCCESDLQSKDRGMYGIGQVADDENVVKLLAEVAVRGVDVGK